MLPCYSPNKLMNSVWFVFLIFRIHRLAAQLSVTFSISWVSVSKSGRDYRPRQRCVPDLLTTHNLTPPRCGSEWDLHCSLVKGWWQGISGSHFIVCFLWKTESIISSVQQRYLLWMLFLYINSNRLLCVTARTSLELNLLLIYEAFCNICVICGRHMCGYYFIFRFLNNVLQDDKMPQVIFRRLQIQIQTAALQKIAKMLIKLLINIFTAKIFWDWNICITRWCLLRILKNAFTGNSFTCYTLRKIGL